MAAGFRWVDGKATSLDDTWEWDGTTWRLIEIPGPGPRRPRARHRLMYSTNQSATILYGGWGDDGKRHSDVLVLRDTTWRPVTPPGRR